MITLCCRQSSWVRRCSWSTLVFCSHMGTALFCLEAAFISHTDREGDPAALLWTAPFCPRASHRYRGMWHMHGRKGDRLLPTAVFPEWYLHRLPFPLPFSSLILARDQTGSGDGYCWFGRLLTINSNRNGIAWEQSQNCLKRYVFTPQCFLIHALVIFLLIPFRTGCISVWSECSENTPRN